MSLVPRRSANLIFVPSGRGSGSRTYMPSRLRSLIAAEPSMKTMCVSGLGLNRGEPRLSIWAIDFTSMRAKFGGSLHQQRHQGVGIADGRAAGRAHTNQSQSEIGAQMGQRLGERRGERPRGRHAFGGNAQHGLAEAIDGMRGALEGARLRISGAA